jgi:hypothetical protein
VADSGNNAIRAVLPDGQVSSLIGSPGSDDSPVSNPRGVYWLGGTLYIADTTNNQIVTLPFGTGN